MKSNKSIITLSDRIYMWQVKRSIKKCSKDTIKQMYYNTIGAIKSGRYNGYLLHRLILQRNVYKKRLLKNAVN